MLSKTLQDGLNDYGIGAKIRALRFKKKIGLVALVFGVGLEFFFAGARDRPLPGHRAPGRKSLANSLASRARRRDVNHLYAVLAINLVWILVEIVQGDLAACEFEVRIIACPQATVGDPLRARYFQQEILAPLIACWRQPAKQGHKRSTIDKLRYRRTCQFRERRREVDVEHEVLAFQSSRYPWPPNNARDTDRFLVQGVLTARDAMLAEMIPVIRREEDVGVLQLATLRRWTDPTKVREGSASAMVNKTIATTDRW
jgi:hypothetical protein